MPRAKKQKLVDKVLSSLTPNEKADLLIWSILHKGHYKLINSTSGGIGIVVKLKCRDCNIVTDITDYASW